MRTVRWNFPETIFALINSAGTQIDHFFSEVHEVEDIQADLAVSVDRKDQVGIDDARRRIEEELADALHSLETFFRVLGRERGEAYVAELFDGIERKNRERGYY